MPWSVSCGPDAPDMVLVTFSEVVTAEELRAATRAAAALGHERHVTKYLADGTAVSQVPRELPFLSLPARMYDELGLDRRELRIAVVVPATGNVRYMVDFYETACLNRGWLVKIFDRHDAAIAWLGIESRAV